MTLLQVRDVSHFFFKKAVLRGVTLRLEQGQILCLLGPSGAGKSTLLRIIAGLLSPTEGKVFISERDQTHIPPSQRPIGFVFQGDSALFPHLTVYQNIAFPLTKGKRPSPGDIAPREAVQEMLHLTGLESKRNSSISELSGGQRQRVALARALVYRPPILLLDEPLTSIDNALKRDLIGLMRRIHSELNTTFLYVTHDEREALQLATHLAVLDEATIQQYGPIDEVLRHPANSQVAAQIGDWNSFSLSELLKHAGGEEDTIFSGEIPSGVRDNPEQILGAPIRCWRFSTELDPLNQQLSIRVKLLHKMLWYEHYRYICTTSSGKIITCEDGTCSTDRAGLAGYASCSQEDLHAFPI
jgi:ABC-type Fe3+/spermidine/putrescine transport system ATPase subunit